MHRFHFETQEEELGRIINPDGVGAERKRLIRAIAISLRELANQEKSDVRARDLAAFIVLGLDAVAATIERTVAPWEKRGYWVKADRFRLDWEWASKQAGELRTAVEAEDWPQIAAVVARIAEKLSGEKIPARHRLGEPWVGAWKKMLAGKGEEPK